MVSWSLREPRRDFRDRGAEAEDGCSSLLRLWLFFLTESRGTLCGEFSAELLDDWPVLDMLFVARRLERLGDDEGSSCVPSASTLLLFLVRGSFGLCGDGSNVEALRLRVDAVCFVSSVG